jgi:glyoxylase I family protein
MTAAVELRGLDHVVLRTARLDAMIAFYRDVLGCALERTLDEVGLVQMRAGASLIDLVDVDGELGRTGGAPPGAEGRNVDHFCVQLAAFDAEAIRAHLAARGIAMGEVVRRYGAEGFGPSVYITDPDGNMVELKGPAEG